MGQGPGLTSYQVGETLGTSSVTLLQANMPQHNHVANAQTAQGSTDAPQNAVWAESRTGRVADQVYASPPAGLGPLAPTALGVAGGSQPHNNLPPYLVVNFIIALLGIFPARS
jgi:microcystin-dependent protein